MIKEILILLSFTTPILSRSVLRPTKNKIQISEESNERSQRKFERESEKDN